MACPNGRTGAVCRRNLLRAVYRGTMGGSRRSVRATSGQHATETCHRRLHDRTAAARMKPAATGRGHSQRRRRGPESPAGNVDSAVQQVVDLAPDGILVIGFGESGAR
jgi:hypothetical protein